MLHGDVAEMCLALVKRGIPFVVEKPLGTSLAQLRAVRRAADQAGVPAAVPLVQRGGPVDSWLARAGRAVYQRHSFIAGPPGRYLTSGSPWMLDPARSGGGCLVNLGAHFADLFLQSSGHATAEVAASLSTTLHGSTVEDHATVVLTTSDGREAVIEVAYAFPSSPLQRYCSWTSAGEDGFASIDTQESALFTSRSGETETAVLDVDSDSLYGPFVRGVAATLASGFTGLPSLGDLEDAMTIVWRAYDIHREAGAVPDLSIDDIARAAGVHRSTVSRSFSRPEAVNAKTRQHVLDVAAQLGYTMSPLAQGLRSKTSPFVPLIVSDITNPFFAELASTMTQAAGDRGYQLLLCVTNGDDARTAHYLTAMQSLYAPFGVIAPSTRVDLDALGGLDFGSRVVVIDRVAAEAQVPSVTVDSARGIQLAFDHLRSLRHRRIGYVSGISGTFTAEDRAAAYLSLVDGDPVELDGGHDTEAGVRAAAHFADLAERPTAIIAANDMTAFALISALTARGFSVPADVSVIGFDGLALGARFSPALTTIRQPIADMGVIAMDLAEKKAVDGTVDHVVLAPELLARASTSGPAQWS